MLRRTLLAGAAGGSALLAGCAGGGDRSDPGGGSGTGTSLSLSSPAFGADEPIPARFSCDGANVSPELEISGVVEQMQSLALVVDDPDAPRPEPYVHWLLWNLPADTTALPESVPTGGRVESLAAVQGTNDAGSVGYSGPCPPTGDDPHTYRFHLFGLDATLDLEPGADRAALGDAMDGRIVDDAVYRGTYHRS